MLRGTETILVVDDEADLLDLANSSLQLLGYRIFTASNVQQALEQLDKESSIDLIFSDVVMPGGMNGYELAELAVAKDPGLKILLTSGYTSKVMAYNGQARFNAHLLTKPYTQVELAMRVRDLLGKAEPRETEYSISTLGKIKSKVVIKPSISTEWIDSYSLGIAAMDEDHQIQLDLFNRCREAMKIGASIEQIRIILMTLQEKIQIHFKREEIVMSTCGYLGVKNHTQVHQMLFKELDKMLRLLSQGQLGDDDFMNFFSSWWLDHIQNMDQAYVIDCQGKEELIIQALASHKARSQR